MRPVPQEALRSPLAARPPLSNHPRMLRTPRVTASRAALPLAALALTVVGCAAPEYGVEYRGATLDVVDMHLHFGEWEAIPPATRRFLAGNFPFPLGLNAESTASSSVSGEGILGQLDGAGIRRGVLFAVYAPRSVGVATNEQAITERQADPDRLYALGSLRFDNWAEDGPAQIDALRAVLSEPGFIGIKLAHAHQHIRFDDPAFFSVYEVAAEFDVPVYLHTGRSPFNGTSQEAPYTDAAFLEDAIAAFPTVPFILGHLGHDFEPDFTEPLDTVLDLAEQYDNVLLEPSALGDEDGFRLPYAMEQIHQRGLVERTIYGSDGPQSPGFVGRYLGDALEAMEAADYSVEEAAAVLAGNFDREFLE